MARQGSKREVWVGEEKGVCWWSEVDLLRTARLAYLIKDGYLRRQHFAVTTVAWFLVFFWAFVFLSTDPSNR